MYARASVTSAPLGMQNWRTQATGSMLRASERKSPNTTAVDANATLKETLRAMFTVRSIDVPSLA